MDRPALRFATKNLVPTKSVQSGVMPERQHVRRLSKKVGAYTATMALALFGGAIENVAKAEVVSPAALSDRANKLVTTTAEAWAAHQLPDGDLMDLSGSAVGGYGVSMIGQAMAETGLQTGNDELRNDGMRAILKATTRTTGGGFETFSLASAYVKNETLLSDDLGWRIVRGKVFAVLQDRKSFKVGTKAQECYNNPLCWSNLKLVGALAKIELSSAQQSDRFSEQARKKLLTPEVRTLLKSAARQTGKDARRIGGPMQFDQAGILSDPTRNPLAYHQLSAMVLGRAIDALGPSNAPREAREAFLRSAQAIVGMMAPDGDVAYIGRGQGQVWNVAAAADALAIAARNTVDPVWRGRFLAGAERAIGRVETIYAPGPWGMPLVPRLAGSNSTDYSGVDGYANSVEYNGLALWALSDAAQQLRQANSAPQQPIGADVDGAFIDSSHTKFVSVRRGDIWFAIHGSDTHADARYDFGLIAAQRRVNGGWRTAIPYRPMTNSKTSGGPVLVSHGQRLVPKGDSITATAQGLVKISGGWTSEPGGGRAVDSNTNWIFRPRGNGVSMAFQAKPSKTYEFQVWYPEGSQINTSNRGISVIEPNGGREAYQLNMPAEVTQGQTYSSAYNQSLASSTLTIHTTSNKKVIYDTTF